MCRQPLTEVIHEIQLCLISQPLQKLLQASVPVAGVCRSGYVQVRLRSDRVDEVGAAMADVDHT